MSNHSVDRIAGTLVGLAAGDALGAGYEFTTPDPSEPIEMKGGGLFAWRPGEWTDDTQMAICIAQVTAEGRTDAAEIGDRFLDWFRSTPRDVGNMTRAVLSQASRGADLFEVAQRYYEGHPDSAAGNGSLMRTAPVALAHIGDDQAIADLASQVSRLTHADPLCQEACVLWCVAIDRAVRQGRLDGIRDGVDLLDGSARERWRKWLDDAESGPAQEFVPNGYVVTALQAAYAAVRQTPIPTEPFAAHHFVRALEAAVRIGHDTDTVGAIAGQLLGARWGVTAVPFRWRRALHGWPEDASVRDLVRWAVLTGWGGTPDSIGWPKADSLVPSTAKRYGTSSPVAVPLRDDPELFVGNVAGLPVALDEHSVNAVVSLGRIGGKDVPDRIEHHEVLLIDRKGANENLDVLLADTVRALLTLRDEGKRVFLHCVGGTSRTPTVAALYLACRLGIPGSEALERVKGVIDYDAHNHDFTAAIRRGCPELPPKE